MNTSDNLKAFLKQNNLNSESFEFSSLDLVAFVVKVEKYFKIQFDLDEINNENFKSFETIINLIERKQQK